MIHETVLNAIRHARAFTPGETLVVAVSGGCDSIALLHILRELRLSLGIALHVATLDHGLRGAAGQADAAFVSDLAQCWNLPCTSGRVDTPKLAREWGMGMEAAARRARYDFLAGVARSQNSSCVALGHHADDQAETLLLRLVRGSGARGLCGMRVLSAMPYHPELELLRPLLALSKQQLQAYCAAHDLEWRQDASNSDTAFARNYLRHEVMDKLARLNPAVLTAFARLAESAQTDEDFFDAYIDCEIMPQVQRGDDAWRFNRHDFFRLHPALQRRLLRQGYRQLADGHASLSHALTLETLQWAADARTGAGRDLGAGLRLAVEYEHLWLARKGNPKPRPHYRLIPPDTDLSLDLSAPFRAFDLHIVIDPSAAETTAGVQLELSQGCDLRLRTRRPGDRFKPQGLGGHSRKLKAWLIDRKVPRDIRDRIPLLTADGDIIAICLGETWHLAHTQAQASSADTIVLRLG